MCVWGSLLCIWSPFRFLFVKETWQILTNMLQNLNLYVTETLRPWWSGCLPHLSYCYSQTICGCCLVTELDVYNFSQYTSCRGHSFQRVQKVFVYNHQDQNVFFWGIQVYIYLVNCCGVWWAVWLQNIFTGYILSKRPRYKILLISSVSPKWHLHLELPCISHLWQIRFFRISK